MTETVTTTAAGAEKITDAEHADPFAPDDPAETEDFAAFLGNPLPADWRDPVAVAARQDCLAAVAHLVGDAALKAIFDGLDARQRGAVGLSDLTAAAQLPGEVLGLVRALQRYVRETQRGDGRQIIAEALVASAGATVAAVVHCFFELVVAELSAEASRVCQEAPAA